MKLTLLIIYFPKVHFFVKTPVPDSHDDVISFIQRLASVGVNLDAYRKAYEENNEERTCYNKNENKIN